MSLCQFTPRFSLVLSDESHLLNDNQPSTQDCKMIKSGDDSNGK